jgi:hypothetical protein
MPDQLIVGIAMADGQPGFETASSTHHVRTALFGLPYRHLGERRQHASLGGPNDARICPCRVQAKVTIGSIVADLIDGLGISEKFDDSSARNAF